jgi:hypothetical protein
VSTEDHGTKAVELYKYTDGGDKNNGFAKTGRILLYTGGDLFTCWLDQVVWMPMEKFGFEGVDHMVTVDFNKSLEGEWRVSKVDDRELKGGSRVAPR